MRRWLLQGGASKTRRFGSVCTGAFVLAAAGLLDGKRVATHWASCQRLAEQVTPALDRGCRFALYVVDGKVWTSAGVTTGIDMALALVEADLGAADGQSDCAALRALRAAAGLPVAVQPAVGGADLRPERGRDTVREADRVDARPISTEPLDVPSLAVPRGPQRSAASIASSSRPRARRRHTSSRDCGSMRRARYAGRGACRSRRSRAAWACAPRHGLGRPSSAASAWRHRCSARCMRRPDLTFLLYSY